MRFLLALIVLTASGFTQDVVRPIRLPVITDDVQPSPVPPSPKPVTVLPEDHFFVVESDVQLLVLHSPDGLLDVTEDSGPIRLRGRFAGGTGKVESKTFTGKWIYTIEGRQSGQAELILVPVGVTSSDQIVRAVLSVNGVKPPPTPPDDDKDETKPKPPQPTSGVTLDIVEDAENRTAETAMVLNALVTWSSFLEAGNTFRIYDDSTSEDNGKRAVQDAGDTQLPVMIIRDKSTAKPLRVLPLPKDFETFKRLVTEVAGG